MSYSGITAPATPQTSTGGGYKGVSLSAPIQPPITAQPQGDPFNPLPTKTNTGGVAGKAAVTAFQNTPTAPKDWNAISPVIDTFKGAIKQGADNLDTQFGTILDNHSSLLQKGAAAGEAGVGTVGAVFGALLSPLQGVAHIPVIGSAVDVVNKLFAAIGEGSGTVATTILDTSPLSQQTKDTLRPLVHDTASLAGQLLAGKVGGDVVSSLKEKATGIMGTLHDSLTEATKTEGYQGIKLPVTSETPTETSIPIKTGEESAPPQTDIPPDQLPTIQMGPKAPSELPTIQTETPQSSNLGGGLKLVPEPTQTIAESPKATPNLSQTSPTVKAEIPTATETPKTTPIERVTTPEGKVTKAANDINTALVKQGIETLPPEAQSKYQEGSYKDSADKVAQMMTSNLEAVKEMARTGANIPSDVHPQILFNAMEALATKNKDIGFLQELAKSPLGTQLSEAGGTLGSHGFNDNPNSTVKIIRDVNKVREDAAAKRTGGIKKEQTKDSANFKAEVKKARSARPTWEEFAKEIACNY